MAVTLAHGEEVYMHIVCIRKSLICGRMMVPPPQFDAAHCMCVCTCRQ